jgi:hypothetical protein
MNTYKRSSVYLRRADNQPAYTYEYQAAGPTPTDKDVPRAAKNAPRAHIGYLVGYDSTNIYRIWVPSRNIVLSTRDVIFDESQRYDPNEPDLVDLLNANPEYICEVIHVRPLVTLTEELTTPESTIPNTTAIGSANGTGSNDDNVGNQEQNEQDWTSDETSTQQTLESDSSDSNRFLPTPRATPPTDSSSPSATERATTPSSTTMSSATATGSNPDTRPRRTANTAPRAAEISGTHDPNFIIEGSRTRQPSTRRQAYLAALQHPENAPGCYAAFNAALDRSDDTRPRLHRDQLPPPPKS